MQCVRIGVLSLLVCLALTPSAAGQVTVTRKNGKAVITNTGTGNSAQQPAHDNRSICRGSLDSARDHTVYRFSMNVTRL